MNQVKDRKKKTRTEKRFPTSSHSSMRFQHTCILLVFVFLAINLFTEACLAQETKEATNDERILTGTGAIVDENIALARNEALSEAFVKAIEEYLIQRIGSQGVANNFQRLDEEILSRTQEAIQDYQIISEFRTERYVRVLAKVRVNEAVLDQKLKKMGLLEADTVQIAVLFMVSEKKEGFSTTYWWGDPSRPASITQAELSLSRIFEERGFRVVNRSFFPPEETYDEGMLSLTLSDEQVAKWGRLLSAQIVIAGEANLYGLSRALVSLKAIKVTDGTIIAQGFREGIFDSTTGGEESAIGLAITSWANDMIPHLMGGLERAQKIINRVTIIVNGLNSYGDFLLFKDFLKKNFPKITSVLERRLAKDSVTFGVEIEGGSTGMAQKLLDHPGTPFAIEIYDLSDQGFTVVVR